MEEAAIAVPLVSTAFCSDCNLTAGSLAELRLVVGGQDLDLLNGVGVDGYVCAPIVSGIHVGRAVNGEFVLIGPCAVDVVGIDSARSRFVAIEGAGDTGYQLQVIQHVAPVEGYVIQLLARDQVRTFAGICLQLDLARVGGDRH